jgi:hypothetical protein
MIQGYVRSWCAAVTASLVGAGLAAASLGAQAPDGRVDVDADPIRCWWRADRGAIHVGEAFTVVLTCAVIETDAVRVVADRARLDPAVLTLAPFELIGGTRPADEVTGLRRFFQYTYSLRLINENAIGRDLLVPELPVQYRVDSRTGDDAAAQGRDRTYHLPAIPLRVISLVAADASDIREPEQGGFSAIESRHLRSRLLRAGALFAWAIAGLLALMALRRAWAGTRAATGTAVARLPDRAVITGAASALALARQSLPDDEDARGRALAALRVIGACAVGRDVRQSPAEPPADPAPGELRLHSGWLRRRPWHVSSPVSAPDVERHAASLPVEAADRRMKLEALADAMRRLTAARFGEHGQLDPQALDASLDAAAALARDLSSQHLWLERQRRAALGALGTFGARAWTR